VSEEYLPLMEAARYIGVSRVKLGKLAKEGRVPYTTSALDARVKLFRRSDLDELRKEPRATRAAEPAK
jgi:hypothetical protein